MIRSQNVIKRSSPVPTGFVAGKPLPIYTKTEKPVVHGWLKQGVCCVLPIGDDWENSFYLHTTCIEELQMRNCQTLRFKYGGQVREISLSGAVHKGFLLEKDGWAVICIPFKIAKIVGGPAQTILKLPINLNDTAVFD